MLAPMRYKNFTWPHNPETYSISYKRETAVHKVPGGVYSMEDLGRTCREMRGQGEFYGPGAYDTFKALATVFYEGGAGTLFHPVWMTSSAIFTELRLMQEPREDYVVYSFAFRETFSQYGGMQKVSGGAADSAVRYTVQAGETLWEIGRRFGVSAAELLRRNPQIENANVLPAGTQVIVR